MRHHLRRRHGVRVQTEQAADSVGLLSAHSVLAFEHGGHPGRVRIGGLPQLGEAQAGAALGRPASDLPPAGVAN